jgi:RHS repeat-associated protein
LPVGAIDPFGAEHRLVQDAYSLLPIDAQDPLGNHVTAGLRDAAGAITTNGNDYRVLAPTLLSDPNRNRGKVELDALGRVVAVRQMGREGSDDGDSDALPGVVFRYDLDAWREGRGPVFAHAASRERHREGGSPFDSSDKPNCTGWQHARTYSDGFGREVMKKAQAEPGEVPVVGADGKLERSPDGTPKLRHEPDRWVGSGRTVFDNKGNPIKKYEPFFSATPGYEDEKELLEWGVTPVFRYDSLGRLVRTDQPNGTHALIVFDAWRQETWDENDTVVGTPWLAKHEAGTAAQKRAAALTLKHAGTPGVAHLDSLGRTFLTIEDNGLDENGTPQHYPTRVELDVEGNALSTTDARGVRTLAQVFDVLGRVIHTLSADAGESRALADIANKPIRAWDPRGYVVRTTFDRLQRTTRVFAQKEADPDKLVVRTIYGEIHPEAEARNLRGVAHQVFDGAGVLTSERFDFKGNPTEVTRRLAVEYRDCPDWLLLTALDALTEVQNAAEPLLEFETFLTSTSFDALNRVISRITPDGSDTQPSYNQAGLLERIQVRVRNADELTTFVENIDYNARGQRILAKSGAATTHYDYDPETFQLVRLVTTRPAGKLQDLSYTHDPAGNIIAIADAVSFGNPNVSADGFYEYDPLYRLVQAEGREHPSLQPTHEDAAQLGLPAQAHPNDWQALRRYREQYTHDPIGNLLEMSHLPLGGSGNGGWTRRYKYASDSSRLEATSIPGDVPSVFSATYDHDAAGNMTRMPHLPVMESDYANRLNHVEITNEQDVWFVYDAGGQRVRKIHVHSGITEERLYLGEHEIYRRHESSDVKTRRDTLHISDNARRICMVETLTRDDFTDIDPVTSRLRYQLDNHLGTACVELDGAGDVISYEEYQPYGASACRSASGTEVSAKRYRYNGKERDEETSLYYYGARYFAPWIGRWTATDPAGFVDGLGLYNYCRGSPVGLSDPNGMQGMAVGHAKRALVPREEPAQQEGKTVELQIRQTRGEKAEDPLPEEETAQSSLLERPTNEAPAEYSPYEEPIVSESSPTGRPGGEGGAPPGPGGEGSDPGQEGLASPESKPDLEKLKRVLAGVLALLHSFPRDGRDAVLRLYIGLWKVALVPPEEPDQQDSDDSEPSMPQTGANLPEEEDHEPLTPDSEPIDLDNVHHPGAIPRGGPAGPPPPRYTTNRRTPGGPSYTRTYGKSIADITGQARRWGDRMQRDGWKVVIHKVRYGKYGKADVTVKATKDGRPEQVRHFIYN